MGTTLTPPPAKLMPPAGFYVQIYLDAGHGVSNSDAAKYADALAALKVPGVAWHSGPTRLPARWDALAKIAHDRSLLAIAAWGLDGTQHDNGSPLTATEKGTLCGQILALPTCAAGLLDAEGRWDAGGSPGSDMNEAGALKLGEALRAVAPHALVGDQPWFAISSHSGIRKTPLALNAGGPLSGFPADEFAVVVNWARFRQAYCNNFTGDNKYKRCIDWMAKDWDAAQAAMKPVGLDRPLGVTFQAYGWDSLPDLNAALLDWGPRKQQPVFLWAEPYPDHNVVAAIKFVTMLEERGFAGLGVDSVAATRAFQKDYNATAPSTAKLDEDGRAGAKTMTAAGFPPA